MLNLCRNREAPQQKSIIKIYGSSSSLPYPLYPSGDIFQINILFVLKIIMKMPVLSTLTKSSGGVSSESLVILPLLVAYLVSSQSNNYCSSSSIRRLYLNQHYKHAFGLKTIYFETITRQYKLIITQISLSLSLGCYL